MDREAIKAAENINNEEYMCWLCDYLDKCPIKGTWEKCPMNAELEAEF